VKRKWDKLGGTPAVVRRLIGWANVEKITIDIRYGARMEGA
jgi:hypothetical protein